MIYLALLPNPFMNAAGSDASACQAAVLVVPPSQPAADPIHTRQLAEIERLLRLNDTSCERSLVEIAAEQDDVPLFLRRARA